MTAAHATIDRSRLSGEDLAELFRSFNEVTARLQETHESLRSEVTRLERELRDANEQLRRTERLAALGEMAAGIAHEVRNPLGAIGLNARMLIDDLEDRPECAAVAQKIADAVRGLNGIVGDVLAFARRIVVRPTLVSASDLLDQACDDSRALFESAGLHVSRSYLDAAPAEVACDPSLLRQALVNVLRNAAEAIDDAESVDRVITLHVRSLRPTHTTGAARVALVIDDTGPGVPDEVLGRMFNPFFTTRAAGTGLGLAIVHRILDAHGGTVAVGRSPSGGARIELTLPTDVGEISKEERL